MPNFNQSQACGLFEIIAGRERENNTSLCYRRFNFCKSFFFPLLAFFNFHFCSLQSNGHAHKQTNTNTMSEPELSKPQISCGFSPKLPHQSINPDSQMFGKRLDGWLATGQVNPTRCCLMQERSLLNHLLEGSKVGDHPPHQTRIPVTRKV